MNSQGTTRLPPKPLHLTIRNDLAEIGRIAPIIEAYCDENGLGEGIAHAVNLSLDELLTNIIGYGYDDADDHAIEIALAAVVDRVTVTIRDNGRAFDPTELAFPDVEAELDDRPLGGLGVHIVRVMMDEVSYRRAGEYNELTLTKRLEQ